MPSIRLRKIGKTTVTVLLAILLGINLLTIILTATGLREPLKWMPIAMLSVKTGSMEPSISAGDAIIVEEAPYDSLAVGDVVTFHRGDELVTHQIIGKDNNSFITKGTANNYHDDPMGPEEYCAKLVLVLPKVGWVLNYLSKPLELFLLTLFLLVLIYGRPALTYLYEKLVEKRGKTEKETNSDVRRKLGFRRALVFLTAMSVVGSVPFMTAAKYVAKLNNYKPLTAGSINFTSNYLSEEGTKYNVKGWNGVSYSMNLRIKDYSNDLLMNMDGQDLYYGLCIEPVESDGSTSYASYGADADYTVSVTPADSALVPLTASDTPYSFPSDWPTNNRYGPYLMSGCDDTKVEHQFVVAVTTSETGLSADEMVRFKILASTSDQNQFFKQLLGDFTFQVRTATNFIGQTQMGQTPNSTLITYTLKTNLIDDGSATKKVKFTWNTSKLYINEFESAAYNIIMNEPSYYSKTDGTLIMPLQAYSSITLQFFKINSEDTIGESDITAAVIS
jgi:signal peptidase I